MASPPTATAAARSGGHTRAEAASQAQRLIADARPAARPAARPRPDDEYLAEVRRIAATLAPKPTAAQRDLITTILRPTDGGAPDA